MAPAPPLSPGDPIPGAGTKTPSEPWLRFDRNELAGAFGDIGTDLPLLVALITTCDLDATSVCVGFGVLQVGMGLLYGIPMPVQPLKAMATVMLAQKLGAGTLAAGGIVIGAAMMVLSLSGALDGLAKAVPREVVRGVQAGLGVTLATLALKTYAASEGPPGFLLASVAFVTLLVLRRQRRIPAPLLVLGLGFLWAILHRRGPPGWAAAMGFRLPSFQVPVGREWVDGALLLALPQLPLSLGNSVLATSQATRDLFPARAVGVRTIGLTFGLMNLVAPWFGAMPACHGCGGLVGFHAFGARTGGAPVLYGAFYVVLGLFFGPGFEEVVKVFPMPILGVVLLVEAISLITLARDVFVERAGAWVVAAVVAAVVGLPNGYLVGLVVGTALVHGFRRGWITAP